jgi:hypothetical protein
MWIKQLRLRQRGRAPLNFDSKDFPIVSSYFFDSCFFCRALLSEEGQTASL